MAIIEQRTYRIKVGMVQDYLKFYHKISFNLSQKCHHRCHQTSAI
jgi:hypothetical protein